MHHSHHLLPEKLLGELYITSLGCSIMWCISHAVSLQKWSNLACTKMVELIALIATIWKIAAEFRGVNGTSVVGSARSAGQELVLSPIFPLASLVNLEPKQPPLAEQWHNCRRRSVSQSSREAEPKGWSHVACNFLEAIKPTLFNSFSNTLAILSVKWPFSAQLSIQSWKTGMWKHFAK